MIKKPSIISSSGKVGSSDKFLVSKPIEVPEDYEYDPSRTYAWQDYLDKSDLKIPPVEKFENAPLHNIFHHLKAGLKVEVPNKDYFHHAHAIGGVFWVATVIKVAGYRALLRYEGSSDVNADFWMNFCSADLHPVGWCANEGKPLVPPKALQDKQEDWKGFLVKRLTGSRTLPQDWHQKVMQHVGDCPFKKGMKLEIIDGMHPERLRPAVVEKVVGRRLNLVYAPEDLPSKSKKSKTKKKNEDQENIDDDAEEMDESEASDVEIWCYMGSPMIFPVGTASRIGYELYASDKYKERSERVAKCDPEAKATAENELSAAYHEKDARPSMFSTVPKPPCFQYKSSGDGGDSLSAMEKSLGGTRDALLQWKEGMKLECMDPLYMNSINVATVEKVLKCGFLKVSVDGAEGDTFLFHKESPYLFPVGYCALHDIDLTQPKGTEGEFEWEEYLRQTKSVAAPAALFDQDNYVHGFEVGSKVEAVDMMEPKLICPATVVQKKGGRLLKIRFDGWDDSYDQWQDFRSPDIFPIGWCELVGFNLEQPKNLVTSNSQSHNNNSAKQAEKRKSQQSPASKQAKVSRKE